MVTTEPNSKKRKLYESPAEDEPELTELLGGAIQQVGGCVGAAGLHGSVGRRYRAPPLEGLDLVLFNLISLLPETVTRH